MNKVSIKLMGGLGNMIFQIACAYAYSLRYNKELIISIDNFNTVHKHVLDYQDNIFKNINFVSNYNFINFTTYTEPNFSYNEIPKIDGNVYLIGYYQSENYFKDYKNEIINLFSFSNSSFDYIKNKHLSLSDKETCSMHVRRGDYVNIQHVHPTQNVAYYMKSLKKMPEESLCLVFSDDIQWCKDNFPDIPNKFLFVDGNKDYEDLYLMSVCKNNIIANSSFSWWGAFFNQNNNKIVVAPKKWFGNSYSHHNTDDLYCKEWIKI